MAGYGTLMQQLCRHLLSFCSPHLLIPRISWEAAAKKTLISSLIPLGHVSDENFETTKLVRLVYFEVEVMLGLK